MYGVHVVLLAVCELVGVFFSIHEYNQDIVELSRLHRQASPNRTKQPTRSTRASHKSRAMRNPLKAVGSLQ